MGLHGQPVLETDGTTDDQANYDFTNSPIIDGEGENRTLKLQFDVSQFDPTEVRSCYFLLLHY